MASYRRDDIDNIFQKDELCCRAMKLFYATGHTFNSKPRTPDRDIRDLVYIDVRNKHVFTPDEWLILDCVESASLLFTNGAEYFEETTVDETIDYFAISLNTLESERSQLSYDIHQIFSQLSSSILSVILFEASGGYMFSLAKRRNEQRSIVVLSDWYNANELLDKSLIDSLDVANISNKNAAEFFKDFSYNMAREYPPVSYEQVRYELLPIDFVDKSSLIAERVQLNKIIQENVMGFFHEYQDDFIPKKHKENTLHVLNTDDFTMELFEIENSANDNVDEDDFTKEDDSDVNDVGYAGDEDTFAVLDDALFKDPIKMLKWIEKHLDQI